MPTIKERPTGCISVNFVADGRRPVAISGHPQDETRLRAHYEAKGFTYVSTTPQYEKVYDEAAVRPGERARNLATDKIEQRG